MLAFGIAGIVALQLAACGSGGGGPGSGAGGSGGSLSTSPTSNGTSGAGSSPSSASSGGNGAGSVAPNPTGASSEAAALTRQLGDRRLGFRSFENYSSGFSEQVSELFLCSSGAFDLTQTTNNFDPVTGSLQSERSYVGSWSVQSAAGGQVIAFAVTSSSDGTSEITFGVEVIDGQIFVDDGTTYEISSRTMAASSADATAECAGSGGEGPSPNVPGASCAGLPAPQTDCDACLATTCCVEAQACASGTACAALLGCIELCPSLDDACVQSQCPAGVELGVDPLAAFINCSNTSCSAACGVIE
jgi:hypothetical protein